MAKQKHKGPEFLRFFNPLLETLHELGGAGRASDVRPLIAEKLKISEKEVSILLKSGVSRVYNQIDWARNYLKSIGYISSEKHGIWTLTDKIPKLPLTDDAVYEIFSTVQKKFRQTDDVKDSTADLLDIINEDIIPPEKQHQVTLLEYLQTISPYGFERLCKRLLIEEGFQNVTVTKKSRDGGIDGVAMLKLNRFVNFKVFFQCKRYKGSVGSEDIQRFKGALDGKIKAGDKGLIITTGYYTSSAEQEAYKEGGFPVELIDGEKLIEMFENLQLGLIPKTVYEIDYEFFKEFEKD